MDKPTLPANDQFPVGARVRVTRGTWNGLSGKIDPLSATVTEPPFRIVKVDPAPTPPPGTKKAPLSEAARYTPKTRLIVVAIRDLLSVPAASRAPRTRAKSAATTVETA